MNKIRIFGIVLVLLGFILVYSFDNSGVDFLFGFLISLGVILLISGKSNFTLKSKKV
jgi:hypothetical protein